MLGRDMVALFATTSEKQPPILFFFAFLSSNQFFDPDPEDIESGCCNRKSLELAKVGEGICRQTLLEGYVGLVLCCFGFFFHFLIGVA